jgi:hypothetical protein
MKYTALIIEKYGIIIISMHQKENKITQFMFSKESISLQPQFGIWPSGKSVNRSFVSKIPLSFKHKELWTKIKIRLLCLYLDQYLYDLSCKFAIYFLGCR